MVMSGTTTMKTIQRSASKTTLSKDGILKKNVQIIHREARKEWEPEEGNRKLVTKR